MRIEVGAGKGCRIGQVCNRVEYVFRRLEVGGQVQISDFACKGFRARSGEVALIGVAVNPLGTGNIV
jgi:hypothetical protein